MSMADSDPLSVAKACSNCAKAKAKCDWTATNARCHRCSRLSKECVPQESVRKRKAPKIRRAVQIAQLEEKVNSLLFVVGTAQQSLVQQCSSDPSPAVASTVSASTPSEDCGSASHETSAHVPHQPFIKGISIGFPELLSADFGPNDPGILVEDPDSMLAMFQKRLASQVPYVVIPPSTSAESLRKEKPFVYMAVMVAASYEDTNIQLCLGKKALEHMVQRMILRGERSMDLLQGLLIFITWYHYFLHVNRQLNNLLSLMSAQMVELGLKRVCAENEVNEIFHQITKKYQGHLLQPKQLTADEKRAVLGCYYLSSCLTSSFSRMDCLRFTPFVEECYEGVAQGRGLEIDANFAQLMKLRSLVEKQRLSGLWESLDGQQSNTLRAPVGMLVRSFQIELQAFKNALSNDQLFNPFFAINYYSAEIHLYESCFKMSPAKGFDYSMESLHLADITYNCFLSTRSFFESFLSVPAESYFAFSIVNFGQLFHAIGALYKLSVFDVPGWDMNRVRKSLDLSSVLNQISSSVDQAGYLYGPTATEATNPWFCSTRKFKTLRKWWDAMLAQEMDLTQSSGMAQDMALDDLQAMINLDFLDENFWK